MQNLDFLFFFFSSFLGGGFVLSETFGEIDSFEVARRSCCSLLLSPWPLVLPGFGQRSFSLGSSSKSFLHLFGGGEGFFFSLSILLTF